MKRTARQRNPRSKRESHLRGAAFLYQSPYLHTSAIVTPRSPRGERKGRQVGQKHKGTRRHKDNLCNLRNLRFLFGGNRCPSVDEIWARQRLAPTKIRPSTLIYVNLRSVTERRKGTQRHKDNLCNLRNLRFFSVEIGVHRWIKSGRPAGRPYNDNPKSACICYHLRSSTFFNTKAQRCAKTAKRNLRHLRNLRFLFGENRCPSVDKIRATSRSPLQTAIFYPNRRARSTRG